MTTAEIDGAYFGTTFPHAFLMTHSHLVPAPPAQTYVPRVFGYKIHKTSEYYTGRKKLVGSGRDREKYRKAMTLMDRYKAGGQAQQER